jgi:acetylornithine deacetylase/succinyl-diaminopimelate desuccinylase-like protein
MDGLVEYVEREKKRFVAELADLVHIPSVSALPEHAGDVRKCAEAFVEALKAVGVTEARMYETDGHPIVYGEWLGAPGAPTALVYGHYDVQPVDPIDEWEHPPFSGAVVDDVIHGRGTADDKGQLVMHIKAAEAHFRLNSRLPLNVKYVFEGEEEIGSVHFEQFLREHRELLGADVVVVSDTEMFAPDLPAIGYGLRGLCYLEVEVRGPSRDLHSGTYGGAIANPANVLCRLLTNLKDEMGTVTVPGFYDRARGLTADERAEFARLPFNESAFREEVGIRALDGEPDFHPLERMWARPTLDINGMWSGFTGEGSKTIIPSKATAKVSCRLVPDQDPDQIADLLEAHLQRECPPSVELSVRRMHGGRPVLTPLSHPAVGAASTSLQRAFGTEPVFTRVGGSIPPVASFQEILGIPSVLMGVALAEDRYHAPNEHFELENFYRGILSVAYLWQELADGEWANPQGAAT